MAIVTKALVVATILPTVTYGHLIVSPGTAFQLAYNIAGDGVTVTDAKFADCGNLQAGLFMNGEFDVHMNSGVVLSSAIAAEAQGPNDNKYPLGDALGEPGSPMLDALLNPIDEHTLDACTLHINFICDEGSTFQFKYVFGSDDYPSTGSVHSNDVMGAFLNGVKPKNNIATVGGKYVSVDTLYGGSMYKDNTDNVYGTEMDGFTIPLVTHDTLGLARTGANEIDIVVADGYSDTTVNNKNGAWLFIEENSFRCPSTNNVPPPDTGKSKLPLTPNKCANKVRSRCGPVPCNHPKCVRQTIRNVCHNTFGTKALKDEYRSHVRSILHKKFC